jgi:hypothetical protein
MCDVDRDQILYLRHILLCFEVVSGLKVNLGISELVAIGEVTLQEELADILSYSIFSLPMKYLGLPPDASFKSKAIWDGGVEKMEKILASWKKIYLFRGGRLMLIKSTLSSLPTYFLSLLPLLVGIARRLECLQRDFLWDGMGGEPKFHLVNWKTICSSFRKGGLGVKNVMLIKLYSINGFGDMSKEEFSL